MSCLNGVNEVFDKVLSKWKKGSGKNICKNKCLLIAKEKIDDSSPVYYVVVSGTYVKGDEYEKLQQILIDAADEAKNILEKFQNTAKVLKIDIRDPKMEQTLTQVSNFDSERRLVISYITEKENRSNHILLAHKRTFSCCERKLLAYFDNDLTRFRELSYIVCRYEPCHRCYWLMKDQPNLYRYEKEGIYQILINRILTTVDLSNNPALCLYLCLNSDCFNEKYRFRGGENYSYIEIKQEDENE